MKKSLVFLTGVSVYLLVGIAYGLVPQAFYDDLLSNKLVFDEESFQGSWESSDRWDGFLCNGSYDYRLRLWGKIHGVEMNLIPSGEVEAHGVLRDVHGSAGGTYLSKATLCLPLKSSIALSTSQINIGLRVQFLRAEEGTIPKLKIKILYTKFDRIYFDAVALPGWLEKFMTDRVNQALRHVWASSFGDWITAKLSKYLEDVRSSS